MFKDYLNNLLVDCHGQIHEGYVIGLIVLITLNIMIIAAKLLKNMNPKKMLLKSVFKLAVKEEYLNNKLKEACVDLHKFKESGIEPIKVLPERLEKSKILERLKKVKEIDFKVEATGKVGSNYYVPYNDGHKSFICENSSDFLYANTLHFDTNKGAALCENELIRWLLNLFYAPKGACGTLTSGGTESIFQACVAYREIGKLRGIKEPTLVMNESAHVGFDKAAFYLGLKIVKIPIDHDTGMSNLNDFKNAIDNSTVAIVCTGINYAHGLVDQICELNEYLKNSDIWIAVDSCLGGFMTSISHEIGDKRFPVMDFRLERVGTISVDPHKYGEGPKGCSVVLFRNELLKKQTIFLYKEWNGGAYATSTLAGSRSAAPMIGSWISLTKIGLKGFIENYKLITATCDYLREEISKIEQLKVIGNPIGCGIAFKWKNNSKDILRLQLALSKVDWSLPSIQNPTAIRITITRANIQKLRECFIKDLKDAIKKIMDDPKAFSDSFEIMVYGTLLKVPNEEYVDECLKSLQLHTSKINAEE